MRFPARPVWQLFWPAVKRQCEEERARACHFQCIKGLLERQAHFAQKAEVLLPNVLVVAAAPERKLFLASALDCSHYDCYSSPCNFSVPQPVCVGRHT